MSDDVIRGLILKAKESIATADNLVTLDQIRVKYLGKKGAFTEILKSLGGLSAEQRPILGQKINAAKTEFETFLEAKILELKTALLAASLKAQPIDITLPGRGQILGSLHPITQTFNALEDFFLGMGFSIAKGPEVETDYYNFTALNFPLHHPARDMQDTFYLNNGLLLRTHTSPLQIRSMENANPPFRLIAPGRVYRCDYDATHSPMFHQLEGLVVAENINFAHLKWMIGQFVNNFFGDIPFRFRASYFPFTEPSAEIDILWETAARKKQWLEVGGCGMVHPNVLKNVNLDAEKYSGFAFGMGVDRLAMLRYGIDDLRLFFENDIRFLRQF